jgi:hypothetical protein
MSFVLLALACRFLVPSRTVLAVQSGEIARGVAINRVAFWSVVVGAVIFVVRFVKR